eukprot:38932-Eustigmatos_ZCMA.PRE.1
MSYYHLDYVEPKRLGEMSFTTYEDLKHYLEEGLFRFEEDIGGLRRHCERFADKREDIYKLYRKVYYRNLKKHWTLEMIVDIIEMIDEEFYDRLPRKWSLEGWPQLDIIKAIKGQ